MRAIDTDESAPTFVDGFRINCNFFRPHMGLENKTPAEVAGIDLGLHENRWLSLLRGAAEYKNNNHNYTNKQGESQKL